MRHLACVLTTAMLLSLAGLGADPPASRPAAPWTRLYADEPWYRAHKQPEQVFTGVLRRNTEPEASTLMRSRRYQVGDRFIYPGRENPDLEKLVGQQVEIKGKPYDVELEGQSVREIWPAAIRPLAAATQPATSSKPTEKEVLSAAAFKRIQEYILARGDRQTYCNMYNHNPHAALGNVNIYLNPDTGQLNINCDPKLSGFNELVIRTREMVYYAITLDRKRWTVEYALRERGTMDELRNCIQAILSDLEKKNPQSTTAGAVERR